jgi:heparin binding hemagglutinin HbhA
VINMPVTLPTAADVRKVREQAAKNAAERAEAARTPLLAVLGAGDAAVTVMTKVIVDAQTRRRAQADKVQAYVAALPQRLTADEARKTVGELREQAGTAYAGFAERGAKAWGKLRSQPQVKDAISRLESYTEKLDARVDSFVDDAHDAAEKALAVVTRQTRSAGEKVARNTETAADETAETVTEVAADAAAKIAEAGDEAAHTTRSTTRRAANRTAPKIAPKTAPKAASPKPATRRTNGSSGS